MKRLPPTPKEMESLRFTVSEELENNDDYDVWFEDTFQNWDGFSELPQAIKRLVDQVAASMKIRVDWRKAQSKTKPQTEESSQGSSPPTQPTTPEPQAGSEPEIPQPSDQSGDNDSPPAEPAIEDLSQHDPQTQDEATAKNFPHTQPSREIADNTQPQQQAQTPMQGTGRPEQAQQPQEEPPHPVEDIIIAENNPNVQASPMVNHAAMARGILDNQDKLTYQNAVAITGNNSGNEPFQAINNLTETESNIEEHKAYIAEAMATFRLHHEIDEINAAGFLIDGLIKEGAITYLNGNSGCGKTFLLADILYCISTGQPFAGRETAQRECYCFEMEDADDLNFRVMALERHFRQQSDQLHLTDLQIKPSNKRDLAVLQHILVENKKADKPPPVFAFDTLSFMISGSENDSSDVMSFVESLLALHAEFGVTFICISHNGKDASKGISGSHKFHAHAKTVYQIKSDTYDGNWVLMVPDKVRFAGSMTIKIPLLPFTLSATEKYPKGIETQFADHTKAEDVPNYFEADVDESGNPCAVEVSQNECYVVYTLGLLSLDGEKTASEDSFRDKLNTLLGDMSDKRNQNKRLRIIKQLRQMAGKGMIRGEKLGDEKTLFSLPDSHPYTLKN